MGNFTNEMFEKSISELFVDSSIEAMTVKTVVGKGRAKKTVIDRVATLKNIQQELVYYAGIMDVISNLAPIFPDGAMQVVYKKQAELNELSKAATEMFKDEMKEFFDFSGILQFYDTAVSEDEETTEETDYSSMSLNELRSLCRDYGLKYTPKQKKDDLIALLESIDNEEEEEDDAEVDNEEEAEDDVESLVKQLELTELKSVTKELGEKVTKKDTADTLIEKILQYEDDDILETLNSLGLMDNEEEEEDDAEVDNEEEAEDDGEITEDALDAILDEEFEDETFEEEKAALPKPAMGKKPPKRKR